jgi:Ca-activated chloride channel family protein
MMTCEQAELHMAELLTGTLREGERGELERHLMDCAACRADFELARAGMAVSWPAPTPSLKLVQATRASFDEPSGILRALKLATAAAVLVSAALILATSGAARRAPELPPSEPVAQGPRPQPLAFVQDAVLGSLVVQDEQGRPVGELGLRSHRVRVEIQDGIAKTTVEEDFQNHTDRRLEGIFQFPLPSQASISRLALEVNGKLEEGTCLERERAREVFESIVRRMKDPALLEWMPGGIFQCRIFPIEPRATKRVVVAYTQALGFSRGHVSYVYPLVSEKTRVHPPEELEVDLRARFTGRLASIESPSHRFDIERRDPHEARMRLLARNLRPEHDLVVTMETTDEELRVVPHRTPGEDGYFALLVTPQGEPVRQPGRYVFLLDVSASVTEPELEVAKRLVRSMIERRIPGDRFSILAHHIEVESGGEVDLRGANDFMDRLRPLGGSDLLGALRAAPEGEILYIGKGNATFGETEPTRILEAVRGRRIRAVAVGSRANATLLEKLGGFAQVTPSDNVPRRIDEIAATLGCPVLSGIQVEGGEGVSEVVGLRDVFYGERLVILGRYRGPVGKLVVRGRGYRRELEVTLPDHEEGNNYVRRLWAQRKIADLLGQGEGRKREVTELGVRYQIMTPYTSFLVLENEQMWKDHALEREVQKEDQVLGKGSSGEGGNGRLAPPGPSNFGSSAGEGEAQRGAKVRRLFKEGAYLYRLGRYDESGLKFEEAFQMRPSSDQAYAFIKSAGVDLIAEIMNSPERKMQDVGRRVIEFAKPGEPLWDEKEVSRRLGERLSRERSLREAQSVQGATEGLKLEALKLATLTGAPSASDPLFRQGMYASPDPNGLGAWPAPSPQKRGLPAPAPRTLSDPVRKFLDPQDVPVPPALENPETTTYVYSLRNADASELARSLRSLLKSGSTTGFADDAGVFFAPTNHQMLEALGAAGKLSEPLEEPFVDLSSFILGPPRSSQGPVIEPPDQEEYRDSSNMKGVGLNAVKTPRALPKVEPPAVPLLPPPPEKGDPPLAELGTHPAVGSRKNLDGKVTAVAPDIGLVVISLGKDDGLLEGDEWVVYRGGEFVAKIATDRADRKWAAGKIVLRRSDPKVGDDASNHLFVLAPENRESNRPPVSGTSDLRVVGVSGDEVVLGSASQRGLQPGQLYSITRDRGFVAIVQIRGLTEGHATGSVWRGLAVGRILQGDAAGRVDDVRAYLESLPEAAQLELRSRVNLMIIRAKMGMR